MQFAAHNHNIKKLHSLCGPGSLLTRWATELTVCIFETLLDPIFTVSLGC